MKKISMKKIMSSTKVTEMENGHTPEWAMVLEPVRKLPTNVGSRIRKCIYQALEKDPPKWAKERLEHSISKEVYKGNASGPTKRAVVAVLTDLEQKIVEEKVKRKKKMKKKKKMVKMIEEEGCVAESVNELVMKEGCGVDSVDGLVRKERVDEGVCEVGSVDDLVMKKNIDEGVCVVDSVLTNVEQKIVQENLKKMKKKRKRENKKNKIEEEGCVVDSVDDLVMKKIDEEGCAVIVDNLVMKEKVDEVVCVVDTVDDLVMKKKIDEEVCVVDSDDDLVKKKIDEGVCVVDSVDDLVMKKKIDEEVCVVDSVDDLVMKKKIDEEVRVVDSVLTDVEQKIVQEKLKKMKKKKMKRKNKKKKIEEEGCVVESADELVMKKKIEEEGCVVESVDDLVMKEKIDEVVCVIDSVDELVMKKSEEELFVVDSVGDLVMKKKIDEDVCVVDSVDDLVMKEKIDEDVCVVDSVDELVMKQCRIVLRRVAAEDKDRIFFDFLKGKGNEDGCFIGNREMGSGCLDFRSIDLKLADGSYCGSHEAFYDDVQEVWRNVCVSVKEQVGLVKLAERFWKIFEEMYDKEVLAIVQKIAECATSAATKEQDDSLAGVSESLIPKAPPEHGICGVCGMDKDDDNVLLCSGCDSAYHRGCLNPPLVKIPEGNWYCPSCVSNQSRTRSTLTSCGIDSQFKDQLANTMTIKEDRELNGEEGTICLQCGDVGFDNAYVYCIRCLKFVVHRYCLPEIPKTFDEFVHWVCDHCVAVSLGSARQKDLLNTQDE